MKRFELHVEPWDAMKSSKNFSEGWPTKTVRSAILYHSHISACNIEKLLGVRRHCFFIVHTLLVSGCNVASCKRVESSCWNYMYICHCGICVWVQHMEVHTPNNSILTKQLCALPISLFSGICVSKSSSKVNVAWSELCTLILLYSHTYLHVKGQVVTNYYITVTTTIADVAQHDLI